MDDQTTILIVDDEPAGREALEGVLFSQGYRLLFAETGQDAYQKALENMPDLILLDVMMPNMNGFDVCQMMRSDPLLAEVPILIVTALDDRTSRLKGIDSGADDFISKPFDRIELRARVRTITRLNRYRRSLLERARLIWVIDQAKDGYLIISADDQIKYANPSAQTLLNLQSNNQTNDTFIDLVRKKFRCEPEEGWNHWRDPKTLNSPLFLILPESEYARSAWFQAEILHLPFGEHHNSVMVRITEISQNLAFMQEISVFHDFIGHKLRTPVAGIIMAAEIIKKATKNGAIGNNEDLIESIILSARRLEGEIQDIFLYLNSLHISKTESHFCLANMENIIKVVNEDLGVDNISLKFDIAILPSTELVISNRSMEIIIHEILENSKKFHPELNPNLVIKINLSSDDMVLISIEDDGIHLSPEQLTRSWLPYYQGEKEFSGEIDGMGLGLSTVATLVWGVGGKCSLLNREDRPGVIINLTIPQKT